MHANMRLKSLKYAQNLRLTFSWENRQYRHYQEYLELPNVCGYDFNKRKIFMGLVR